MILAEILIWEIIAFVEIGLGFGIVAISQGSVGGGLLMVFGFFGFLAFRYFQAVESFKHEQENIEMYKQNGGYLSQNQYRSMYRN